MAGIDTYSKLILHCNGVDGSTTFTDDSYIPYTITPVNQAQIDTADKKFGTASGLFDGTSDYITAIASTDWNFDADFTIDFWFKTPSVIYNQVLIKSVSNQNWTSASTNDWALTLGGDGRITFQVKNVGYAGGTGIALANNTWYHIAVIRYGTSVKIYRQGVVDGVTLTSSATFGNTQTLEIGRIETNLSLKDIYGWIDEFRISKGIARWTSNFTPPTEEYTIPPPIQKTILSNTKIKVEDIQQTITSDAKIFIGTFITSDAKIKALNIQETVLSDSKIVDLYQKTVLSDTKIKALGIQKTILSNAKVCIQVLVNIINKINFAKESLSNINNKVNTVIQSLYCIDNIINFVKQPIYNILNDIRTKKQILTTINNDVRFVKSWQVSAAYGFQSLGKSEIRVSISGTDQTDVLVDSISIGEGINTVHTASFDLGRAYDATKPAKESIVLITYKDWTLYRGYITEITPGDSPESIRIGCNDEFWYQNRIKTYFFVGHKPTDNKEKYYSTIKDALLAEFSLNVSIGDFVPQTIDCFAVGKSDVLVSLISACGNYGIYYDTAGQIKIVTEGSGNITSLQRQTIGTNLNLYHILSHQTTESIEGLVNKYRVQMGDKIIKKFSASGAVRNYTSYQYRYIHQVCLPVWDSNYEVLAKNSDDGFGFDNHPSDDNDLYKDVFRVWHLPYISSIIESWTDRYSPLVEIYSNFYNYFNIYSNNFNFTLREGFTIDYENDLLIFNEPMFLIKYEANGKEVKYYKAPGVKIKIWKKTAYPVTNSESENPETDVANPLMFFTDKMGTYPTTILEDLALSNLAIQVGGSYVDDNGVTQIVPSWDDTVFAQDYANWQLSKICDEKISTTIEVNLDTLCFYGINLTNQIKATGLFTGELNIENISINMDTFTTRIQLRNGRYYKRTTSLPSRGE